MHEDLTQDQTGSLVTCLRSTQIVILAMALGLAAAIGVAATQFYPEPAERLDEAPVATLGIITAVVLMFVKPAIVNRVSHRIQRGLKDEWKAARAGELDQATFVSGLCRVFQLRQFLGAALVEAVAFLNLAGYLVDGMFVNGLVAAVLVMTLFGQVPTRHGLESWMDLEIAGFQSPAAG